MSLSSEKYGLIFKKLIEKRDLAEYRRYERLIADYLKLLYTQQEYLFRIKEYSNINEQAISKITEGIFTSNSSIAMQSARLEEYSNENKILSEKLSLCQQNYHETKENLVQMRTKFEIASEDLDELKQENNRLSELLTNEKQGKLQLAEEHKVLQSVLIAHEREIFNLKEENEHMLNEILRIKEKQINEVLRSNELELRMTEPTKGSQSSSKITVNSIEGVGSSFPSRVVKKIDLNDDIYDISAGKCYTGISTGNNVVVYKLKSADLSYYGILKGCAGIVNSVDINSDETFILTGSSDRSCRIWNIHECKLADSLMGHEDKVLSAKFSPHDSNRIISGGKDRNIKQWDTTSLSCLVSYYIPSSCIDLAAISSHSGISAHLDKCCRIWDLRTKHLSKSINIPDRITSLAYAGNTFAVSSRNNKIYFYDMRNYKPTVLSHNYLSIAFDWAKIGLSYDGLHVVAGSRTSQMLVWNVAKNECLALDGHSYPIVCTTWSYQGSNILSSDSRRNLFLWQ